MPSARPIRAPVPPNYGLLNVARLPRGSRGKERGWEMRTKRNRYKKNARMSFLPCSYTVVGIIILTATIALVYWHLNTKCAALGDDIRRKEHELQSLKDEFLREEARWNANKTPEKLDAALLAHGLVMRHPKADQLVRMDGHGGKPLPNQLSIAKFMRNPPKNGNVARNKP